MRLLLRGFEPFLDYEVNPTMPIVESLNGTQIGEYDIIGRILPVSFKEAQQAFVELVEDIEPDGIISLGVAVGRFHITPERVAINMRDSNEPDNDGNAPQGEAIRDGEAPSYFSTLPVQEIVDTLKQAGYPAKVSNTAGTYVCNTIMYEGLHYAATRQIPSGFIHIPANFDLAIALGNVAGWHDRDLLATIQIAIETVLKTK